MMMASRRASAIRALRIVDRSRSPMPILQLQRPFVARQHDVGGFVEQGSQPPVAAFGDAAGLINFAGLIAARHQPILRQSVPVCRTIIVPPLPRRSRT